MKLLIIGPPGAGKGTISRMLKEKYGIMPISTGDILREEIKKQTELGKLAEKLINKGEFVPDDVVTKIVKSALKEIKEGYILDGFPRNLTQAQIFDELLKENNEQIDLVIHLVVNEKEIIKRISNRLVCPECKFSYHKETLKPKKEWICDKCGIELIQREDDKPEYIKKRLNIYHEVTEPLVEFYRKKGLLLDIDSNCSLYEHFEKVEKILKELNLIKK